MANTRDTKSTKNTKIMTNTMTSLHSDISSSATLHESVGPDVSVGTTDSVGTPVGISVGISVGSRVGADTIAGANLVHESAGNGNASICSQVEISECDEEIFVLILTQDGIVEKVPGRRRQMQEASHIDSLDNIQG